MTFGDATSDAAGKLAEDAGEYFQMDYLSSDLYKTEDILSCLALLQYITLRSDHLNSVIAGGTPVWSDDYLKSLARWMAYKLLREHGFSRPDLPVIEEPPEYSIYIANEQKPIVPTADSQGVSITSQTIRHKQTRTKANAQPVGSSTTQSSKRAGAGR